MLKKNDTINFVDFISHAKFDIPGGIHPRQYKSMSNQRAITSLAPAKEFFLAENAKPGNHGKRLVEIGDRVLAGQKIFESFIDQIENNTHSPYDGEVTEITHRKLGHASGLSMPGICISRISQNHTASLPPVKNWQQADPTDLIKRIHEAGIVGLGGAAFPTHVKLNSSEKKIETLIINAMECEPFITCDDVLIRERASEILQGSLITAQIVGASQIMIGIEDNKPEATNALAEQISKHLQQTRENNISSPKIQIIVAETKYPSGGEKQLIQLLTGQQVPQNKYPAALGILVQNIATLFAIYDAVCNGQTLTHRLVTLTGNLVEKPGNYWIAFGTPLSHIISKLGIPTNKISKIILGGPLMGTAIDKTSKECFSELNIPTQKSTNCIIFNSDKSDIMVSSPNDVHDACIRCGECEVVCPASLVPQQLYWFAKSEQWEKLEQNNLRDCIECGACSYVCPSQIPLVSYYRFAKSEIKHLKTRKKKSELAKQRFDNRESRLARIKTEREKKRKKTAEARMLTAANKNKDPDGKKSAIQAALQRVKDKKEEQS